MNKFGSSDNFAIWIDYYYLTYKDDPEFIAESSKYQTFGDASLFVKNKNLFEFLDSSNNKSYSGEISYFVEFLCRGLFYHITDDEFPIKTKSTIGVEMMNETLLVHTPDNDVQKYALVDWDNVDMELYEKIDIWNNNHGMLTNAGGFFLPDAFIRKVDNTVEISWQNDSPRISANGKFYYKHKKGVEYIDIKYYKDTVVQFCLDFLNRFEHKYPALFQEYRINLQKAIDIKV